MPKSKINDYIFYKITCLDDSVDLCYVGSTANWKERQRSHKNDCTNENSTKYNLKVYKTIRANGSWCNFKMIELGTREQLTLRQAQKIEEDYRIQLKANLNERRCYITPEQKLEYDKQYDKERYKNNIEYFKEYKYANKEHIKEYNEERYKNNRDKILVQNKEYRTNNKDKLNERASEKITCECGCDVRRSFLARHKKSQKHIKLLSVKDIAVIT